MDLKANNLLSKLQEQMRQDSLVKGANRHFTSTLLATAVLYSILTEKRQHFIFRSLSGKITEIYGGQST
jgi:hypothetical protein